MTSPQINHTETVTAGVKWELDYTVFGLFVDIHYESDLYGTKNRAPNYYT